MDLATARRNASELSGGTSSDVIKDLVVRCLRHEGVPEGGRLLDYGAGKGELLMQLHALNMFQTLAGADLFSRPEGLPDNINWHQQDLNDVLHVDRQFDAIVCTETIEHLENPRHTFRCLSEQLRPGGLLVLTMPNQESIRSYVGLIFGGHFTQFLGSCYPAHITALVRMDLIRMCQETGFGPPVFRYTDSGCIPKLTSIKWQQISFGLLKGRLFSDNVAMIAHKLD